MGTPPALLDGWANVNSCRGHRYALKNSLCSISHLFLDSNRHQKTAHQKSWQSRLISSLRGFLMMLACFSASPNSSFNRKAPDHLTGGLEAVATEKNHFRTETIWALRWVFPCTGSLSGGCRPACEDWARFWRHRPILPIGNSRSLSPDNFPPEGG